MRRQRKRQRQRQRQVEFVMKKKQRKPKILHVTAFFFHKLLVPNVLTGPVSRILTTESERFPLFVDRFN